ncbi:MAG TPA: nucleotide exchange factor GrpE [Candidatus Deferrimicrobium sp.]|nr:nucleotide exchange factor GrpE [Candidatus Deferrimicrobium sp.]
MKEEKSSEVKKEPVKKTESTEFEEVDVGLEDNMNSSSHIDNEVNKTEVKPPIPEEWKGKSEEEIALLWEIQDLKKKLEDTKKDWFDKYARLQAEFENFQKRNLKEKETFTTYANSQLISKLLPILDSSEIMLKSIEPKLEPKEFQGIKMIFKELYGVFEKEGLTPIKAKGEAFDPFVHEILCVECTDECPDETILEEFQKGYKLKDRVLRPSKVKIAKKKIPEAKKTNSESEEEKIVEDN